MIPSHALIEKAKTSNFYLKMLNFALARLIPFNKPHGLRIMKVEDESMTVKLPYKSANLNHLKGLHACVLATLSEFTTGLVLLNRLDASKFRIIMKSIHMEYHYQGKSNAYAQFTLPEENIKSQIMLPLETQDNVNFICTIKIHDKDDHHLCTGTIDWQIKKWDKVRTKVN